MGSTIRKPPESEAASNNTPSAQSQSAALPDYVTWFEIPALDMKRSTGFYNTIFDIDMDVSHANDFVMALFPVKHGVGGAVVAGPGCVPSSVGPLIYLNGGSDLNTILSRVEEAGGRVVMPKTLISEEVGHFALFIDTEGNRLALHSRL